MSKKNWHTLSIPEGKINDFKIVHIPYNAGAQFKDWNLRTAYHGNPEKRSITFEEAGYFHELRDKNGRWMTDLPIEQSQHDRELKPMSGQVLVGGLGLGYAATRLARRRSVTQVVVIEKSKEVIDLVAPHIKHQKIFVCHADLFDYLKKLSHTSGCFDWAFYDIWRGDSESTFHEMVVPLRELSIGIVPDHHIVCWNEGMMRVQLLQNIRYRLLFRTAALEKLDMPHMSLQQLSTENEDAGIWHNWYVPFFKRAVVEGWSNDRMMEESGDYVRFYGRPHMEW